MSSSRFLSIVTSNSSELHRNLSVNWRSGAVSLMRAKSISKLRDRAAQPRRSVMMVALHRLGVIGMEKTCASRTLLTASKGLQVTSGQELAWLSNRNERARKGARIALRIRRREMWISVRCFASMCMACVNAIEGPMSGRKRPAPLPRIAMQASDENGRSRVAFQSMLASPLLMNSRMRLMRAARVEARHLAINAHNRSIMASPHPAGPDEAARSRVADCNHLIAFSFACAVGLEVSHDRRCYNQVGEAVTT